MKKSGEKRMEYGRIETQKAYRIGGEAKEKAEAPTAKSCLSIIH